MQRKLCARCGETKQVEEFPERKGRKDGRHPYCRPCEQQYHREYRKKNREALNKKRAAYHRRRYAENPEYYRNRIKSDDPAVKKRREEYMRRFRYGLEPEDFNRMVAEQNGLCAICGGPPGKKGLVVDHCHTTGEVRALLCMQCNIGLGSFKDDLEVMATAIAYLRRFLKEQAA